MATWQHVAIEKEAMTLCCCEVWRRLPLGDSAGHSRELVCDELLNGIWKAMRMLKNVVAHVGHRELLETKVKAGLLRNTPSLVIDVDDDMTGANQSMNFRCFRFSRLW